MIVFRNLGRKEINSSGTIITDSRTVKRLKARGELLKKEEVYQAIFYPEEMLIGNFYQKHVLKKSTDKEFTILVTEDGKEPTLKECEELIRIALLERWISKSSFIKGQYYEIKIPKIKYNQIFGVCNYNSVEKKSSQIMDGLLRIDREPKIIRAKDLLQEEKEEYEKFKKMHYLHPEILLIEHIIVVFGKV